MLDAVAALFFWMFAVGIFLAALAIWPVTLTALAVVCVISLIGKMMVKL